MSLWRWVREVPVPEVAGLTGGAASQFTELKLPAGLAITDRQRPARSTCDILYEPLSNCLVLRPSSCRD
jgi:hypothetical protein